MEMPQWNWRAVFGALALWAVVQPLAGQERPPVVRTVQAAAVRDHYPPLPIALDTPALKPGRTTFTTEAELDVFLDALASTPQTARHLAQLTLGCTPGGRPMRALLLTREGAKNPADVTKLGRPVVWLIGQQHGNEPAGGEAMLALAKALAGGELEPLLDQVSVVIIPRANPDGAAAGTRENAAGFDLNRDHALLTQTEVQVIHGLLRQLPPVLVIDTHEFTVGQRWVEKFGGLQSIDLMVLSATHPMVPLPLKQLAAEVFQPAIEAAIAPYGLKWFVYHTISTRAGDHSISFGGNATGIARNAFGLLGAVSILLETRGVGIGFDSYQRRVATHYIAARALLRAAAANAQRLAAAVAAIHTAEARSQADIIIAHKVAKSRMLLPLIDPITGAAKTVTVDMLDTRVITSTRRRVRPAGYIIAPERAVAIASRLANMGARTCTVRTPIDTVVERYDVLSLAAPDRRAINPSAGVTVRLRTGRAILPPGSLYVPLDQPASSTLALALEPDAPGSLSALTLLDRSGTGSIALQRLPREGLTPKFVAVLQCSDAPADGIARR